MKYINLTGWNSERRIDGIREFVGQLVEISKDRSQGRMPRLRSGLVLLEECLKQPTKVTIVKIGDKVK